MDQCLLGSSIILCFVVHEPFGFLCIFLPEDIFSLHICSGRWTGMSRRNRDTWSRAVGKVGHHQLLVTTRWRKVTRDAGHPRCQLQWPSGQQRSVGRNKKSTGWPATPGPFSSLKNSECLPFWAPFSVGLAPFWRSGTVARPQFRSPLLV